MKEDKSKDKTGAKCSTSKLSCPVNYIWGGILLIFLVLFIVTTIK
jgi:hypothetical protein